MKKKKKKKKKKIQNILSDFFYFLLLKFSVYLNRHVFVMYTLRRFCVRFNLVEFH